MNYISLVKAVGRLCQNDEACLEACSKFVGLKVCVFSEWHAFEIILATSCCLLVPFELLIVPGWCSVSIFCILPCQVNLSFFRAPPFFTQAFSERDLNSLLEVLSNLLLNQRTCIKIAYEMPETLPQILSRALSDTTPMYTTGDVSRRQLHERRCVTLSKLAHIHPDVIM